MSTNCIGIGRSVSPSLCRFLYFHYSLYSHSTFSRVLWCQINRSMVSLSYELRSRCVWHDPTAHCNTLQHIVTHCNTLQHAATHYNTLQYTTTHCKIVAHRRSITCSEVCLCDMTHFYAWHGSFLLVLCLIFVRVIHQPYVCSDSFLCVIWHDSILRVTRLIPNDIFLRVTWYTPMYHMMIYSYQWHFIFSDTNHHRWRRSYLR